MRQIPVTLKFLVLAGALMFSLMYSNSNGPEQSLKKENDSLRALLASHLQTRSSLQTASAWADSIMHNLALAPPASPFNLSKNLENINAAVRDRNINLAMMEETVRTSHIRHQGFLQIVDALKGEVSDRVDEVEVLTDSVNFHASISYELFENAKLQDEALTSMYQELESRELKLAELERRAHALKESTEGEIYYVKGQKAEDAARRIRLAPQKRKEAFREALELYRKSYSLGKQEASIRITSIEKVLSLPLTFVVTDAAEASRPALQ
jgi:hypothetical protein